MNLDKFLLITDLEGISGVESFEDMQPGGEKNQGAKEILTADVNCVIKSILDYGRESNKKCEIHIMDGHGSGGLIKEKIFELPSIFYYPPQWSNIPKIIIERQINALLFIGQHAMEGTPKANLGHTFSRKMVNYYLIYGKRQGNFIKEFIGEIGFTTAMASELGVPTIFLSGDDKAVLEAKRVIPGIMTVTTKYGLDLEKARFRQLDKIRNEISFIVKKAIEKKSIHEKRLYQLDPPFELEIGNNSYLAVFLNLYRGAIWKGKKIVAFKADTFAALDVLRKGKKSQSKIIKDFIIKLRNV